MNVAIKLLRARHTRTVLVALVVLMAGLDYTTLGGGSSGTQPELFVDPQTPTRVIITDKADAWPSLGLDYQWHIGGRQVSLRNDAATPPGIAQIDGASYWAKAELGSDKSFGNFIKTIRSMGRDGYCIVLLKEQSEQFSANKGVMPLAILGRIGDHPNELARCNGYASRPVSKPIFRDQPTGLFSDRW